MDLSLVLLLIFLLFPIILWKNFQNAGQKGYFSIIPLFNYYIWLKITSKPLWWFVFLIIPFLNFFMVFLMLVELAKTYGKNQLGQQALAVLFPFIYFPLIGFDQSEEYISLKDRPKYKKSGLREWVDAIIFAVVAASIIRMFLFEAYTIPTSSMEKSLLVGDFLFVNKIAYGPKLPNTPLSFPFVHNTMPLSKTKKSYLEWVKWPYYRFPGYREIKNNDVVVFNYPNGDTVALKIQNPDYYALSKKYGRKRVWTEKYNFGDVISRPVDKRENYIKRCIGIPGDSLQIIDQEIYINGKLLKSPGIRQFKYLVETTGSPINPKKLEMLNITENVMKVRTGQYILTLNEESLPEIEKMAAVTLVTKIVYPKDDWAPYIFPYDSSYKWNEDNFGPLLIPKKGMTIQITTENLPLYQRIIEAYEKNKVEVKGNNEIYINDTLASEYCFKMDYYWMMGDNRHNSADSRFWGFVPEDHIVGRAAFVWLSLEKNKSLFNGKIRWNKIFRGIY